MRRSFLCTCVVIVTAIFAPSQAFTQDYPRAEIFGGYSYLHLDTQGISSSSLIALCTSIIGVTCPATFKVRPGFNGWEASGQFNFNRWLGVKGDFSGHYGNLISATFTSAPPIVPLNFSGPDEHVYDYLFGPVVSHRARRYTVFAHSLFGGEHVGFGNFVTVAGLGGPITLPGPSSSNWFAVALGGGLDLKVTRHFAVRAGQFDYQLVNSSANGHGHQNDFRFSSGIVFGFSGK
jgi:opacity protein-like surface antigen